MAEILKFVYTFILLISLFIVATKADGAIECETDVDCKPNYCMFFSGMCVDNKCLCSVKSPRETNVYVEDGFSDYMNIKSNSVYQQHAEKNEILH
ncbi:nodulin-3-like [Vicia villosa]|uniref:nodulin-3-like n=1 Tax=Vicia villosa TaxID=3911 RepID=UPI00273BC593|nr:nodulin-3-like [Vicia villosa]